MYPELFDKLVEEFKKLPGVGLKTAQRYAFSTLDRNEEEILELAKTIVEAKQKLKHCDVCGFLSQEDKCFVCKDENRDNSVIMVVSYVQDVMAIEKTGTYRGLYHVLNGVISSSKGIYPEDLNINSLLERLDDVKEVIIATSPTIDGETTALYLDKLLAKKEVLITRLAHGLPMGSSLDYADDLTLIKAMDNRREF